MITLEQISNMSGIDKKKCQYVLAMLAKKQARFQPVYLSDGAGPKKHWKQEVAQEIVTYLKKNPPRKPGKPALSAEERERRAKLKAEYQAKLRGEK